MLVDSSSCLLFSGNSHPEFSKKLSDELGVSLAKASVECFPDNEIRFCLEVDVRGVDVFVIQTLAHHPNDYIMELLLMVDALKRASARSITAVIPYFGYARQDHKDKPGEPITAKLVADLLERAGISHLITMDLHSGQVEGFFDVPVDNLQGLPSLVKACKESDVKNVVVTGPDIGSIKLAHAYASSLGAEIAVVDKHRLTSTEVEVLNIIGDIEGKDVLLADDMCSTGGTLVSAAKACQEKGANRIDAVVTHGLFVGDALEKIEQSPIERLFVSNTIPLSKEAASSKVVRLVSVASLFAKPIRKMAGLHVF